MKQVLFVCTGNICRSPMAEALFNARMAGAGGWTASSAGTAAVNGWPASAEAVTALKEKGIELKSHQSRPVTRDLIDAADFVFTMTERHRGDILAFLPEAKNKVHLVTAFSASGSRGEIPDPIGSSLDVYRRTRDVLESAIADIILTIMENTRPDEADEKGQQA